MVNEIGMAIGAIAIVAIIAYFLANVVYPIRIEDLPELTELGRSLSKTESRIAVMRLANSLYALCRTRSQFEQIAKWERAQLERIEENHADG